MNQKEHDAFNEIISKGYESLIYERPQKPFEHFIYHLLEQVSEQQRKIHPELLEFYNHYKAQLKEEKL